MPGNRWVMAGQVHMFAAASRLVLMALFSPAVDLFPREGSTRPPGGGAASVGASGKEYETASEVIVGEGMPLRDDFFKEEARRGGLLTPLPEARRTGCVSEWPPLAAGQDRSPWRPPGEGGGAPGDDLLVTAVLPRRGVGGPLRWNRYNTREERVDPWRDTPGWSGHGRRGGGRAVNRLVCGADGAGASACIHLRFFLTSLWSVQQEGLQSALFWSSGIISATSAVPFQPSLLS